MAPRAFMLAYLCFGVVSVNAIRSTSQQELNETGEEDGAGNPLDCTDYCIMCNDGATVYYGRSRSWVRAAINFLLEGLILPITAAANTMTKMGADDKYTSWTGYLPTTGFFCEKVDVVKFPVNTLGQEDLGQKKFSATPLMMFDRNPLGKMKANYLKPYTPAGRHVPQTWAQPGDLEAYMTGCKKMKASGLSGGAAQAKSTFQSKCSSEVTKAVFKCSEHSRVCGSAGVSHMTYAKTPGECQAMRQSHGAAHSDGAARCLNPNPVPTHVADPYVPEVVPIHVADPYMPEPK